ncbi:MAG: hypothetical protein KJO98_01650 [Rhodothermia bacterium]|nr:hypothetical protein [Rhodothermia bacterium]
MKLTKTFPGVEFRIAVAVPKPPIDLSQAVTALVIQWNSGPDRELVEETVAEFQSLDWNPVSGVLEIIEHMEVTEGGSLQQVQFGVDYILCEGPKTVPTAW